MISATHPPESTNSQARILVVDDDPVVREVVVESIRIAGHDVDVAGDGQEALEKNTATPFDIIVTDMRLPGLDGLNLIKRLKSDDSPTDVIVITGYGSIENAVECMKAGALEYLIKPFTLDQIQVAVRKALDLRELRRRAQEREFYRELSYVDGLTGIHNRRYFDEALAGEIEKAKRHHTELVLLMIDIDDFKLYNDRNGHQKGDEALVKIGTALKKACRAYDVVTRYGGEEFAVLFPGATRKHAVELANRVVKEVRATRFDGEERLPSARLTVSVGAACFPDDGGDVQSFLRRADQALYAAKKAGKNIVVMADRC
jgi:diguanylate cyclase (GGDEF)-like protein